MLANDNVDTDQVIPARFLKTLTQEGLGDQLFYDWRYDQAGRDRPDFVLNRPGAVTRTCWSWAATSAVARPREHCPVGIERLWISRLW